MSASSSAPLRRASKALHHKASVQDAVKVRGRFYYLGKHGTKAAREECQRIIREVWAKPDQLPSAGLTLAQIDRLTIVDLLTGFWEHADAYYVKGGKPTSTIAGMTAALRRFRELHGHELAENFGPLKLKALRKSWVDDDLALKSVNEYTAAVKRVFFWAAENELVPSGVAHSLKMVRHLAAGHGQDRETEPVKAVDDGVVDATLPHLPPLVTSMVRFQRLTGHGQAKSATCTQPKCGAISNPSPTGRARRRRRSGPIPSVCRTDARPRLASSPGNRKESHESLQDDWRRLRL
jgi:hypothetical protein